MGAAAPSVDQISARQHIARSTLYAALRGTRVPTRSVLAALVTSWGGDEKEWMRKRSAVEHQLELIRHGLTNTRPGSSRPKRLLTPADHPSSTLASPQRQFEGADLRVRYINDIRAAKFARALRNLRQLAGHPTLRDISSTTREQEGPSISASAISDLLNRKRAPRWEQVEAYLHAVHTLAREARIPDWARPDLHDWRRDWKWAVLTDDTTSATD